MPLFGLSELLLDTPRQFVLPFRRDANLRTVSEPDSEGITYPIYPYFMLDPNGEKMSRVADANAKLENVVSKFLH